ncbi:SIR2 family NAD-dependent protein deacylase [Deinococcus peraridilitoris]|uniref:NAD-dependent protein deacylase n=1 Tax=Deinococcus peraridilitoris (strain DSM 19664 / LMG 22246 / CIP 109416 / KR-200) TaxID=937777 RepID=K9ZZS5_DEIPD|nr:NAD-dependent deacylase [Deinococcus peraridilitoris]AFZ66694.1 NAD-dependent protein deacetylase, SIR2 family [Deinococcus peraridilitoris DSM 19664]
MSLSQARRALGRASRVAVLTGAGISAESGIPTFRDAQTGLWARFTPEELASPAAYARDPLFVWNWYAERYRACMQAEPNAAHRALVELERRVSEAFLLVTQNVDGLHGRAGSKRLIELHGNLNTARCERCALIQSLPAPRDFSPPAHCQRCGARARPNVVWFGEMLLEDDLKRSWQAFESAEVALVIGTSSVVEPAASLGRLAKSRGAYLIELGPDATPLTPYTDTSLRLGAVAGMQALMEQDT